MEHVSSWFRDPLPTAARGSAQAQRRRSDSAVLPFLQRSPIRPSLAILNRSSKRTRMWRGGWERRSGGGGGGAQGRRLRASRRNDRRHLVDADATLHVQRPAHRSAGPAESRGGPSCGSSEASSHKARRRARRTLERRPLKRVAKSHGATINDFVMAAIAEGVRNYINDVHVDTPPPQDLTLTTTDGEPAPSEAELGHGLAQRNGRLLADYAGDAWEGCDLTAAFVPMPCGDMPFSDRLQRVSAATRRMKLTGAPLLLRSANNLLHKCFGTSFIVASRLPSKDLLLHSRDLFEDRRKLCGVPVTAIYGAGAATWGAGVTLLLQRRASHRCGDGQGDGPTQVARQPRAIRPRRGVQERREERILGRHRDRSHS